MDRDYLLLYKMLGLLSRRKSLQAIRATAIAKSTADYELGKKDHAAGSASMHNHFYCYIVSETARLSRDGQKEIQPYLLESTWVYGWAAHLMPTKLYEYFHTLTYQDQDAYGISALLSAGQAVKDLRTFPELEARRQSRPKARPRIESVDEKERRARWYESPPTLTCSASVDEVSTFMQTCTADDLHEIVGGATEREDNVFVFEAVSHPICDRATALEFLRGAASWQRRWHDGACETDHDEHTQHLFRKYAEVSNRLNARGYPNARFRHTLDTTLRIDDAGSPSIYHPEQWLKWRLEAHAFAPTQKELHKPQISFLSGEIRPTFDVWKNQIG